MSPRVYVRKFDHDEARRLRAEGLSLNEIARRLGVSQTGVLRVVNPEVGAKMAAASSAWMRSGRCVECGAPCSRPHVNPSGLCKSCGDKHRAKVEDGKAYCPNCATWKDIAEFSPSSQRKARGVHGECRQCDTARRRAWRHANRERARAYDRERKRKQRAAA